MKLSAYKADRPLSVYVAGQQLSFRYNPRWLTLEKIDAIAEVKTKENATQSEQLDSLLRQLGGVLTWIDFQDDDGQDILPTYDNLCKVIDLDLMTAQAIDLEINKDLFAPLPETGDNSNSGSSPKEKRTRNG